MSLPPSFDRVNPLSPRFWLTGKVCKGCGGERFSVRRLPDFKLIYRFRHTPGCRYAR